MKYRFKSLKQILDIFEDDKDYWVTEISHNLWKSRTIIHKYLKELVSQEKIIKIENWPHTRYRLNWLSQENKLKIDEKIQIDFLPDYKTKKQIDEIFLKFTPEWKILKWFDWLKIWCLERNLDLEEKLNNYLNINNLLLSIQNSCWLLESKKAFAKDFENVYLDSIFYADQYKWMEFWRWKLAELTFYWKQSQNKELIKSSIREIISKLECLIYKNKYDGIAITPWSIDRKNQLLKILKNDLKIFWTPFINIIKYYPNDIAIPQKSLKTRNQRIQNARNTIFVDDFEIKKYKNILLIDDFVWSWATLNETAKKLKSEWIKKVDWFAFVWNMNLSYEIINEI